MSRQSQIKEQLLVRAEEEGDFRARLLKDPKAAIRDATGLSVPDSINIHVIEDSATDYHLVLPPSGRGLSDGELDAVSGGSEPGSINSQEGW